MLSPANADLVRHDGRLPGLATLLDPDAFLAALQASVPPADLRAAHLRYLRYKPGQNCLAAYSIEAGGSGVDCHAKAYRRTDAVKLAKAMVRPTNAGPLGRGRFVWPEACVEVCVFPNDNKVESVAVMAEPGQREDFLRRHLPGQPKLWQSAIRPLAYKPERRWVGALELGGRPQAVCKLYGGSAFDAIRSRSKGIRPGDVLRVAPMLGWSKRRRALFFGWRDGRLLSEALMEPAFDPATLSRVGIALSELHRQKVSSLPLVPRRWEAESWLELGELLAFIQPQTAERMAKAARTIASQIGGWPQRDTTIHGDFYAKQVLLGDDGVTLLDLDDAGRGDPLLDLGTFIAHLEREVICGRFAPSRRDAFREALLAGYTSGPADFDPRQLDLYAAGKLFARMPHFFRTCDPDWPVLTAESLGRVESLLGVAAANQFVKGCSNLADPRASGAALAPRSDRKPATGPETRNLARALDLAQAQPLLESALREHDPGIAAVSVRYARLRRHKPGRRALIEYGLECWRDDGRVVPLTLLGKLRHRGLDAENLDHLEQLLAGGFSAASEDGISIPAILGRVPELGMWLQEKVGDRSAAGCLLAPEGPEMAQRAAEAVHKLHRSEVSLRRQHTIADELNLLQDRLDTVATQRPAWRGRLATLLEACTRLAQDLPMVLPRPIHRDFYHDQVLPDAGRVWLLDLDLMCAGDPALDAGNFVGHLLEWAVRLAVSQPDLTEAAAVFTDRYLALAGGEAAKAVEVYTTYTLARHIFISTQFPDRSPFTEAILNLCEERCGLARTVAPDVAFVNSTP